MFGPAVRRISVLLDSHPLLLGIALASGEAERQRALDLRELGVGQIDIGALASVQAMARVAGFSPHELARARKASSRSRLRRQLTP
jgi:hypothetical protein